MSRRGEALLKCLDSLQTEATFSDVARSLGFVLVVPCFDCAYQGTHDCTAKDSAECMAFCSRGRKRDDDQR